MPANTATPQQDTLAQNETEQDHKVPERQSVQPKVESTTTKRRRLLWDMKPDGPPTHKKARIKDTKHEASAPAESISSAPIIPSDRAEMQEPHAIGNPSLPDGQSTPSEGETADETTSEEDQPLASVDTRSTEATRDSTSKIPEDALPLPPQDDSLHKVDDVTADQPSVKPEATGNDSLIPLQPVHSATDDQPNAVHCGSPGGGPGLVPEPKLVPTTKEAPASSSTPASDESRQTALERLLPSAHTDALMSDEPHEPISMDSENTPSLPPQKHTPPNTDGANTTLLAIKQEVVGTTSLAPAQTSHLARETSSTNVRSQIKGGNPGLLSASTKSPAPKQSPVSKSTAPSNLSHQTGEIDMIDLTDEHDHDILQQVSGRQINVIFIDEHGQQQHTISFEECNTAEDMFEEACAWDIADKETKMLEITIPGRKPARVRKNNEKHFAQKVFEPMKDVISGLGEGQSITLTVQKYM